MHPEIKRMSLALDQVSYPGYHFEIFNAPGDDGAPIYLRASFVATDAKTKILAKQNTRKWSLSLHMTNSEVVQTALKCVLTSIEHEARESFTYMGAPVFGPHFDVDDLAVLCTYGRDVAGGRPHTRQSDLDRSLETSEAESLTFPSLATGAGGSL